MSAPLERRRIKIHGGIIVGSTETKARDSRESHSWRELANWLSPGRLEPRLSRPSLTCVRLLTPHRPRNLPRALLGDLLRCHDQRFLNEPLDEDCYRTPRPRRSLFITIRKPVGAIYVVAYGIRPAIIAGEQCFRLSA